MEDVLDLASSNTESTSGHSMTLSSSGHSLNSPLLSSTSSSANWPSINALKSKHSKHSKANRRLSIGASSDAINQIRPYSNFPTRSKSFDVNSSRPVDIVAHERNGLHDEAEALSSQRITSRPFINVDFDSSLPLTPSIPRRSIRHTRSKKCQQQRKSIDLGYNMMQTSLRRLRRSPSLWTGDGSLSFKDPHDRRLHNLRAEPRLSDQQKFDALKRARKIAQVFGSEAPIDVVHGNGYIHRHSANRRNSISTIASGDAPTSNERGRASFDSSLLVEINQSSSTSSNPLKIPSNMASDIEERSSSFLLPSSFTIRRRRAAKLSHFFGVSYQDISQSVAQKLLPPAPRQTYSEFGDSFNNPAIEVDVKVAGRRFWGLSDGEMKTADVADVIGKLRGLKIG